MFNKKQKKLSGVPFSWHWTQKASEVLPMFSDVENMSFLTWMHWKRNYCA